MAYGRRSLAINRSHSQVARHAVWLMVIGGLFLVVLVVGFVIAEWRSSHGT